MSTKPAVIETLPFPGAPDIPGLSLRRFRGEADYEVLTSIVVPGRRWDGFPLHRG